ncbi:hypothetical protein CFC21_037613 [Triticum aestivum]|uniref:Cyclin-like domain-containing protein n=3 Tax=Triticum TaxID=4564 RepID=A0A9R0RX59_TRITD|nr:hypothetical protein CFC21_037613 [Triticum aestivum]VAH67844.1 unnamed protein product [Triticum turgidum subsp. durum]
MGDVANAMRYCPDCRRAVAVAINRASGDTVCALCARVLGQRYVDKSSEWRTFLNQVGAIDGRSVGGAADPSPAQATVTVAYPAAGDERSKAAGHAGTHAGEGASSAPLPRMRGAVGAGPSRGGGGGGAPRMRGAVGPVPDRALAESFHGIDDMAARLQLTAAVKNRARDVIRKLENTKAFPKGGKCRNRQALYAACLHMACRAEGTPRTFKELASVTGDSATAGVKDIGRLVKVMKDYLRDDEGGQAGGQMMMIGAIARPGDYMRRFGSLLGMEDKEVGAALEAATRLEKNLDVRHNPDSIAAAVMYMAIERAGVGRSIRDVSMATGVSEGTIREIYYKDLYQHANMLFGQ